MAKNALLGALALIFVGDVLAWSVQTDLGAIDVQDVRWQDGDGKTLSALLYVPPGATAESPAPGVLAVHGYINSRETQDGFAIELARRGFVVLALDQTGHGFSDPPAFRAGFGGPAGLSYLRSLDFVDGDNVGLEGHSMGGWAVLIAAAGAPDDYRAVVIEGSSTGSSGAPDATDDWPRNLAVVFSKYDEFSGGMWGSPVAADVPASEKLRAAFGTDAPVEPGRIYGSVDDGTARIFWQPPVTHPADHFSTRAIGHAIEWLQTTLDGERPLPASDQVWYWKEVGNLIALLGMVLLILAVGDLLLDTPFFRPLVREVPPSKGATGAAWWGAAFLFAVLPAVTLFPFKDLGGSIPVSALFPQAITTQVMAWAVLVGVLSAVLFGVWHLRVGRRQGATWRDYGVTVGKGQTATHVARSLLLALLVVGAAYVSLLVSSAVFTVDYRFWVFAVKPMGAHHGRAWLSYVVPFVLFFLVYGVVLFGQLRRDGSAATSTLRTMAVSILGFVGLIAFQYTPLFLGGTLAIPGEALWSIIAFQFVPIMAIVGLVTAHFQRRTASVWPAAFLSGFLVTWIVVASQATHYGG